MSSQLVGHASQRLILKRLLNRQRVPQAIMFAGISGIGKRMCAIELAQSLFCTKVQNILKDSSATKIDHKLLEELYGGCNKCTSCYHFTIGNLPDLLKFNCRDREVINTESIRSLLYELNLKSFSGTRIIILDNAEEMNLQSANVLLKSVEEPRPGTHFLLISSNPYRLPATLLSRCHMLFFNQLTDFEVLQILNSNNDLLNTLNSINSELSPQDWSELADGSFDNLIELSEHAEEWLSIKDSLSKIASGDSILALELVEKLIKNKENLRVSLKLLQLETRRRMILEASERSSDIWGAFLTNLLAAERFIYERNITSAYLLRDIFLSLLPSSVNLGFTVNSNDGRLLESFLR